MTVTEAPRLLTRPIPVAEQCCPFCGDLGDRIEAVVGSTFAIRDGYPVTPGHFLILPKRHVADYFDLTDRERRDTDRLLRRVRDLLLAEDPTIEGFNIGVNCGIAAGQTVSHAHIHLIPRRSGDVPDPRGGVRGVIADRMRY